MGTDPLGWRSAEEEARSDEPLPLVTLGAPCGVRAAAIKHLDAAHQRWREAFTGGSCVALVAAVRAGLGVAPMGAVASGRLSDADPRLGLPVLPSSEIVMFVRASSPTAAIGARALDAAVRTVLSNG